MKGVFKLVEWKKELKKNLLIIPIIIVLTITIISVIYLTRRKIEPVGKTKETFIPVSVKTVKKEPFQKQIILFGTVTPILKATVSTEVSGPVVWVSPKLELGQHINKGEILAKIDSRPYRIAKEKAKALMEKANASLEQQKLDNNLQNEMLLQIKTELLSAEKELKRKKELLKSDLISIADYDREESAFARIKRQHLSQLYRESSSDALLKQAEAAVKIERSDYEQAALDLEHSNLKAPFTGSVSKKYVQIGELVRPKDPVFEIVDYSTVVIETGIQSIYIDLIRNGVTVTVSNTSYQFNAEGELKYLSPEANPKNRLFTARIFVNNSSLEKPLLPGIFVSILIKQKFPEPSLLLPFSAITEDKKGSYVYLAKHDKQDMAKKKEIKKVWEQGGNVIISGILEGDRVIIHGHENLADGTPIKVMDILDE